MTCNMSSAGHPCAANEAGPIGRNNTSCAMGDFVFIHLGLLAYCTSCSQLRELWFIVHDKSSTARTQSLKTTLKQLRLGFKPTTIQFLAGYSHQLS